MKTGSIKLHIEELVLHGFAPADRHAIADAVQRELSDLLAKQFSDRVAPDSLANNVAYSNVDAGTFHLQSGARADSVGTQIARAVHGGLIR